MLTVGLILLAAQENASEWSRRKCAVADVVLSLCPENEARGAVLTSRYLAVLEQQASAEGVEIGPELCERVVRLISQFLPQEEESRDLPSLKLEDRYGSRHLLVRTAVDAVAGLKLSAAVDDQLRSAWSAREWQSAVWNDPAKWFEQSWKASPSGERPRPVGAVFEHVLASFEGRIWAIPGGPMRPRTELLRHIREEWAGWFDTIVESDAQIRMNDLGADAGEDTLEQYKDIASYLHLRESKADFPRRLKRLMFRGKGEYLTPKGIKVGTAADGLEEIACPQAETCLVLALKGWVYEFTFDGDLSVTLSMNDMVGDGLDKSPKTLHLASKRDKASYKSEGNYGANWDPTGQDLYLDLVE